MITVEQAAQNIGRKVVYTPFHGEVEEGVITGVSGSPWIFVRFGSDVHSKATAPAALDFAAPTDDGEAEKLGGASPEASEVASEPASPSRGDS